MWLLVAVVLVLTFFYVVGFQPYKYWESKGVLSAPSLPIFGNMWATICKRKHFCHVLQDFYSIHPGQRYVGVYIFTLPVLVVRDLELIKSITVKDFDTFPAHRPFIPEDIDPLWAKNLFAITDPEKWHDMRSTLSPSFTSNKMKIMFGLIKDCAKQLGDHFVKKGGTVAVEMKDVFTRYTSDVIATTAFGVTCDSLENPENEFYLTGKDATDFTGWKSFRFLFHTISPALTKLLNVGIISRASGNFFRRIIKENLTVRETQGIVRPDMLHLLMEARKGRSKREEGNDEIVSGMDQETVGSKYRNRQRSEITDEDITAQSLIFFLAGLETVSTAMVFAVYELTANADVQKRLQEEVDRTLKRCNGDFTYEALMGMKYLDMVVSETLRLWPPTSVTDRRSIRPYTINPESAGEPFLELPPGTNCCIPIFAIQRDPKYFPNPDEFYPERFSEEKKCDIKPGTYMPFGAGPRICLGSRFALLEIKIVLAEILSKFELVPVEKTRIPVKLSTKSFQMQPEGGMWIGLKPRSAFHD